MSRESATVYRGIDHVQLAAPRGSEAEARRFYGELLGLPELPKPAKLAARGGCWFRCGAHQLHIGIEDDFRAATKAHPALELDSEAALDALYARLVAAGVRVKRDEAEVPGVVRFFASDPFGNRLELLARR
ncbi:MAG TPA: VOC family protein [Polyangiaceae bacterium]|nr:VOC family protein [Polyangiaceae bacterium]